MSIVKTIQPYEMLTRWKDGELADSSFRVITTISDDQTGEVYAVTVSDPMTLQMAIDAGYTDQITQALNDISVRISSVQAQLAPALA